MYGAVRVKVNSAERTGGVGQTLVGHAPGGIGVGVEDSPEVLEEWLVHVRMGFYQQTIITIPEKLKQTHQDWRVRVAGVGRLIK